MLPCVLQLYSVAFESEFLGSSKAFYLEEGHAKMAELDGIIYMCIYIYVCVCVCVYIHKYYMYAYIYISHILTTTKKYSL